MMSSYLLPPHHVEHGFKGWVDPHVRSVSRLVRKPSGPHATGASCRLCHLGGNFSARAILMFLAIPKLATKELAPKEDQGVIFGIMTAPANATIDDTIRYADAAGKVFKDIPDTRFTFQITNPSGGFGGMVLKPWGTRKTPTKDYLPIVQHKLAAIPAIQMFPIMPEALPGSDNFPVSFVIASTADQERILEFAKQIFQKAMQAHMFQFGDIDTKIDQPQAQIVLDHDKISTMGLNMQQIGADLSASIGGNYVNWFNMEGLSYKVIPQIKRVDRLNPEQLNHIYVTGPNSQLIPLSTIAHIKHEHRCSLIESNAAAECRHNQRRADRFGRFHAEVSGKRSAQNSPSGLRDRLHWRFSPAATRRRTVLPASSSLPLCLFFLFWPHSLTVSAIR